MSGDEHRIEGERLAILEEQVRGMRSDFNDFKQEMKQTVQTFVTMHKDYMPRAEAEKENTELRKKVEMLEIKVEKLHGRPTLTAAGVFTAATTIIGLLISYIALHGGK